MPIVPASAYDAHCPTTRRIHPATTTTPVLSLLTVLGVNASAGTVMRCMNVLGSRMEAHPFLCLPLHPTLRREYVSCSHLIGTQPSERGCTHVRLQALHCYLAILPQLPHYFDFQRLSSIFPSTPIKYPYTVTRSSAGAPSTPEAKLPMTSPKPTTTPHRHSQTTSYAAPNTLQKKDALCGL
jgi:hypothetical protein